MSISEFIKRKPQLSQAEEIIFFGGSFNPWHSGHLSCLKLLPKKSKVIVIPDHNPYKDLRSDNEDFTNLKLIQKELDKLDINATLFEQFYQKKESNPTHTWIDEVHKNFTKKKLSLLIGFDTYMGIDKWIEAEKLLGQLDKLFVASRLDNKKQKDQQQKNLLKIAPDLDIIFLGNHPHEDLSSTQMRSNQ